MSQTQKLLELLKDGKKHSTPEIQVYVYGANHLGVARISARVDDLRKLGYNIPNAEPDPINPAISWYRMIIDPVQETLFYMPEPEREVSVIF